MTPIGESIGAVATATSWMVSIRGSASKPISATTIRTDGAEAAAEQGGHRAGQRLLRRTAERP